MGKVIQFPKIKLDNSYKDRIFELEQYISDQQQSIGLCSQYCEYYRDNKTLEEYLEEQECIEQMKLELEKRKRELKELESRYTLDKVEI